MVLHAQILKETGRNVVPHRERMTPVDTAWLRMDRPNNPMIIVGVERLEGRVDPAVIEDVISKDELVAMSDSYKRIAGYDKSTLRSCSMTAER